jgi:uncharacterized protein YlxW (UPF0749 family)
MGSKISFTVLYRKMENRELLKAIKEMMDQAIQAKADADQEEMKQEIRASQEQVASLISRIEASQAKMDAETKTNQEMLARMEAKTDVNLKEMREDIISGQAEMRSTIGAIEEKMEAVIQSLRA